MKILGSRLEFISKINRDGSGTVPVEPAEADGLKDEKFGIIRLSMTEKTWVASSFNLYVVRIKDEAEYLKEYRDFQEYKKQFE